MVIPAPRAKKKSVADDISLALGYMIAGFLINLLGAMWLMLGLGVAHGIWPIIPATGYWATYLMLVGLSTLAGATRRISK